MSPGQLGHAKIQVRNEEFISMSRTARSTLREARGSWGRRGGDPVHRRPSEQDRYPGVSSKVLRCGDVTERMSQNNCKDS